MTAPTNAIRQGTYNRDHHRCVACGTHLALTYQHRRATGMGGSKIRPGYADGVTACYLCNTRFESDLQSLALVKGWKVRRHNPLANHLVPVFYTFEQEWFLLNLDGTRTHLSDTEAAEYRGLAGMYDHEEV
jgi:hypothetical protein